LGLILKVARPGQRWKVFSTNDFKPPYSLDDWAGTDPDAQTALVSPDEARHKLGEVAALAALASSPLPHDFPFHAAVLQFRGKGSTPRCAAVIEVPAASLPPSRAKGRDDPARFSLLARIKDAAGQVAGPFSEEVFEMPGRPLTWSHSIILPPGRYTLEAALVDRGGERESASVTPIEIAELADGIGLSSVILLRQTEQVSGDEDDPLVHAGQRVVPVLDPVLGAGAAPVAFFLVYPDQASAVKPSMKVELFANGQLVAAKVDDKLPRPDESGVIPMRLRTAGLPGNWELRITVTQGGHSATHSVRYSVAAK
jgi:hypothetical protein